jgi:hypothetical protein
VASTARQTAARSRELEIMVGFLVREKEIVGGLCYIKGPGR